MFLDYSTIYASKSRVTGFTLLELLVGLAAFSLVLAGGYAAIDGLSRAHISQQQAADQLQQLQIGLQQMQTDMQQIVVVPVGSDNLPTPENVLGGATSVTLLRGGWSNPLQQTRSNIQRVRYRLLNNQLQRSYWLNATSTAVVADQSQPVIDNINNIRWRYRGNDGVWRNEWPIGVAGGALVAVEVQLELVDGQRITRVFLTVAAT